MVVSCWFYEKKKKVEINLYKLFHPLPQCFLLSFYNYSLFFPLWTYTSVVNHIGAETAMDIADLDMAAILIYRFIKKIQHLFIKKIHLNT